MVLDSNNHSVFSLHYHLVLVVKYRKKVFNDEKSTYAKDIFENIKKEFPENHIVAVLDDVELTKEK